MQFKSALFAATALVAGASAQQGYLTVTNFYASHALSSSLAEVSFNVAPATGGNSSLCIGTKESKNTTGLANFNMYPCVGSTPQEFNLLKNKTTGLWELSVTALGGDYAGNIFTFPAGSESTKTVHYGLGGIINETVSQLTIAGGTFTYNNEP